MNARPKSEKQGYEPNLRDAGSISRLSAPATRARIREALERAGRKSPLPAALDAGALERGRPSLVRSLPGWIGRFGLLAGDGRYGLWCEPAASPGPAFPSQVILDLPSGRYMLDILDAATSDWISRESAEGGPLVAGLPYTGNPVLVWIRNAP